MQNATEPFKQLLDNPSFKPWLSDMIFASTHEARLSGEGGGG